MTSDKSVLLSFNCQPDSLEPPEKGVTQADLPQPDGSVGMPIGLSRLFVDVGRFHPLWVVQFPRQMVLECVIKIAKHEPVSDPASSLTPRFLAQGLA